MKSMGIVAVFVGILAIAASTKGAALVSNNSSQGNVDIGSTIKQFYTAIQEIMPCGYSPWKLPPLAPFTMDEYQFDLKSGHYGINGSLSNIVVTGLNNFNFLEINFDNKTNRFSYDVFQPEVQILAEGNVDAWVTVAGLPMKFAFDGPINIKIVDGRAVGRYTIEPNAMNPQGIQFSDIEVNFYLGDIIFNNWNKNRDIAFNNFINKWMRESVLLWTQELQAGVSQLYTNLLQPLNAQLAYVNISEMTNWLVKETAILSQAGLACKGNL